MDSEATYIFKYPANSLVIIFPSRWKLYWMQYNVRKVLHINSATKFKVGKSDISTNIA